VVYHRDAQVTGVSFPERTIELVVIPYETPATVQYGSRVIEEVVSRGAFGKARRLTGLRKVNRDHDPGKPVGYVKTMYPNRDEGLVAELRISPTPAGDETLILADEHVLEASAGFGLLTGPDGRAKPGAEVWEARDRRRLNHLWLDHVAMVSNPAYSNTAAVNVRSDQPGGERERVATPNLNEFRIAELRRVYADLDARYIRSR
jgi:phage head maturation protease